MNSSDGAALVLHPTMAQEDLENGEFMSREEKIRRHKERVREAEARKRAAPVSGAVWPPSMTELSAGARQLTKSEIEERALPHALRRGAYVGLTNQGATCYMNSLLQTLYMTPDFRSAMYAYVYDTAKDGPPEECIPFHLQRLFALLQLSDDKAVPTRELTRSFGWNEDEAFQQHDAQELLRVLLDALEDAFSDTDQKSVVNDLYAGRLVDYCRCEACGTESTRQDSFLDLSLSLRPFGSQTFFDGLEASIDQYLKPESLDGENMVFCETCEEKRAAQKGFRLSQLPLLLTVQLKRFDYDLETFRRVKLNNRFAFPEILDLNSYRSRDLAEAAEAADDVINDGSKDAAAMDVMEPSDEEDDSAAGAGNAAFGEVSARGATGPPLGRTPLEDATSDALPDLVDFFGNKSPSQMREEAYKALESGDWVYELYSVLVHSGGTYGGHYYAYIKNLDDQTWHRFDDSSVTHVPDGFRRVQAAWGGEASSASAYMLMYRKISRDPPLPLPLSSSIPDALRELAATRAAAAAEALAAAAADRLRLSLPLYAPMKGHVAFVTNLRPLREDSLKDTIQNAAASAWETQDPEKIAIPLGPMRLRRYSRGLGIPREVLGDEKEEQSLQVLGIKSGEPLYLEVKPEAAAWCVFDPDAVTFQLLAFQPVHEDFAPPLTVQVPRSTTLGDLKLRVQEVLGVESSVHLERLATPPGTSVTRRALVDEAASMTDLRLADGAILHVDVLPNAPSEPAWDVDRMYNAYIRERSRVIVSFARPPWAPQVEGETEVPSVEADKRWTVEELREAIRARLDLPDAHFRLRISHAHGWELAPGTLLVGSRLPHKRHTLHLTAGEALPPGHFSFRVFLYPYPRRIAGATPGGHLESEPHPDATRRVVEPIRDLRRLEKTFELLGTHVVTASTPVLELRGLIYEDLVRHVTASSREGAAHPGTAPVAPAPLKPAALPAFDDDDDGGEAMGAQNLQDETPLFHAASRLPCGAEHLRLRQKLSYKGRNILRPGPVEAPWTLGDNLASMHDQAELAVQLLAAPEALRLRPPRERETVLEVHWFDRARWIVHEAVEVVVTKQHSARECSLAIERAMRRTSFGESLYPDVDVDEEINADAVGTEAVEDAPMDVEAGDAASTAAAPLAEVVAPDAAQVSVFRPAGGTLFVRHLPDEQWLALAGDRTLEELMWYISDGDVVLAQDPRQPLGPVPPEFMLEPQAPAKVAAAPLPAQRPTERGLRIRHRGKRSPGPNGSVSPSPSPGPSPSTSRSATPSVAGATLAELSRPAE